MNRKARDEALKVLMEGGSYRGALDTAEAMAALNNVPTLKLHVPIRFRKRYEDMANDRSDPDTESDEGPR